MADVLERIDLFRLEDGRSTSVRPDDAGFTYRHSELPADGVVTGVRVRLAAGDPGEIRAAMEAARDWRRRTQPLAEPNCGSVFKNPPGDHAARLIESLGLKGLAVGGASVSTKHANFIIAGRGCSASDVLTLIRDLRRRVREASGVDLEPEVHLIGAFDDVPA